MSDPIKDLVYFYPEGHQMHHSPGHPEQPERVERIRSALTEASLWDAYPSLTPQPVPAEILESIHVPDYLRFLEASSQTGYELDQDTYTTPASYSLALKSAGGAVAVAEDVWNGRARAGFAITRPPGHHATPTRGMGFCLLNNIALAAETLLCQGAHRLAILDLDLHHGNGTQEIFWKRKEVFFLSIHQSPLYPGSGALSETGEGAGQGYTANFPLPPASGDEAYAHLLEEIILPLLGRYQPEMLLISYGFDPHWLDHLGHLRLSAKQYGLLMKRLADWAAVACAGKIALFLEGGYSLDAGEACSLAVVSALLGKPWVDTIGPSPRPEGKSWQATVKRAREIWAV